MKECGGSSCKATLKYIVANNPVADGAKAQVRVKLAVRKMLAAKKLVPVKGSFKLPKVEKVNKVKKPVVKKVKKAKKPAAKKAKKIEDKRTVLRRRSPLLKTSCQEARS